MATCNTRNNNNAAAAVTIVWALFALALSTRGVRADPSSEPTPVVQTASGKVVGVVEQGYNGKPIYAFKGIPYAADPSGSNRWAPPKDPESWTGVRNVSTWGNICPQEELTPGLVLIAEAVFPGAANDTEPDPLGIREQSFNISEDCLVLNVFSPSVSATAKAPVMVWIHGGALKMGTGQEFPPQSIVSKDVILVTINYRLGYLGYFAHPELNATNFGLLDQVKALEWVQENIGAFGGDPSQVTIAGESAGGVSVQALMVSPLSEGLFQGAISESGDTMQSLNITMSEAGKLGELVAETLDIPAGPGQLEQMRSLPASSFVYNLSKIVQKYDILYFLYVDNMSMDTDILTGFEMGLNHDVPFLIGSNANETNGFADTDPSFPQPNTSAAYEDIVKKNFGHEAETVLSILPVDKEASQDAIQSQFAKLTTDLMFGAPAYTIAESMANRSETAYLYMFTQAPSGELAKDGVPHGFDLPYIFNYTDNDPIESSPVSNPELAETMVTYWTQFVRNGNPNTQGVPEWKPFDSSDEEWQVLGPKVGSEPIPEDTKTLYEAIDALFPNKAAPAVSTKEWFWN